MIQHQNSSDLTNVERDLSADKSLLRDPLYLSPEEETMYVRAGMMSHASQDNVLDFTDPNGESIWKEKVILNEGWTWFADNKDNDKYGFIANNITGGQHIAFSITGGDHGLVEVSVFIHAYDSLFKACACSNQPYYITLLQPLSYHMSCPMKTLVLLLPGWTMNKAIQGLTNVKLLF